MKTAASNNFWADLPGAKYVICLAAEEAELLYQLHTGQGDHVYAVGSRVHASPNGTTWVTEEELATVVQALESAGDLPDMTETEQMVAANLAYELNQLLEGSGIEYPAGIITEFDIPLPQDVPSYDKSGLQAPGVVMAQTKIAKDVLAARIARAQARVRIGQRLAQTQEANADAIKQQMLEAKRNRLRTKVADIEKDLAVRDRIAAAKARAAVVTTLPPKIKVGGAIYVLDRPELRTAEIKAKLNERKAATQKARIDALSAKLASRRNVQERLAALKEKVVALATPAETPRFIRVAGQVFEKIETIETPELVETSTVPVEKTATADDPQFIRVAGKVFERDEVRTAQFRAAQVKTAAAQEAPAMIRVAGKLYARED